MGRLGIAGPLSRCPPDSANPHFLQKSVSVRLAVPHEPEKDRHADDRRQCADGQLARCDQGSGREVREDQQGSAGQYRGGCNEPMIRSDCEPDRMGRDQPDESDTAGI